MQGQKKIEKYQFSLKRILGQGSYATVFLGKHIETGEAVAVKVIEKKIFSNAYNVKNIQSEIDIMKKVQHQNIVLLHDIYQTTNNMYIVTELCPDGDLFKLLQAQKKFPQNQAKAYLRDIMEGAKYLHKNGIIHRDLKPANILLKKGRCKLSDFGFAKSFEDEDVIMRSIVGTPLYMSPQILKKAKYTTKSDLWSIGLIYYEMLHGKTPWPANNEVELINGIYQKKIHFAYEVSQKSKDFIRKCLEIQEEDRMTWEEAFQHRLLENETVRKPVRSILNISVEDMENFNSSNKMKTPTNLGKDKSIGANKSKKDVSSRKIKKPEECLTPKNKLTPKAKDNVLQNKSGLKINANKKYYEESRFENYFHI